MKNKNYLKRLEYLLNDVLNTGNTVSFNSFLDRMGDFKTEKGTNEMGDWVKTTYTSNDGTYVQVSYLIHGKLEKVDTNSELHELNEQLQKCVEKQDFETAAVLRDKIKSFDLIKSKQMELKKELDEVIKEQNFERAIEIREELKKIN
jgi:protein-arginine kinase activator protein McsA